jgi:hypothetical protein
MASGRMLNIQEGQSLDQLEDGYRYRYTFPALPADVDEVT